MNRDRVFNFNAGPAVLPEAVLEELKENLLSYHGSGIGVMEMSHRSKDFQQIITEAEAAMRRLLNIGDDYAVLFATGGATAQFSMVPMNLLRPGTQGNYMLSGIWAEAAYEEAKKFGDVHVAASSKALQYKSLPTQIQFSSKPAYLHYTSNNTVIGSQYHSEPDAGGVPLICDASSDLLHRRIDVSKYGLIYAGAQKNLGPAGTTVIILRKQLLEQSPEKLPLLYDYRTYVRNGSLYNTPPTLPIYVVGLVLKWIEKMGGADAMEQRNREKADLLYSALDANPFYAPYVERSCRSLMNVTFRLANAELEDLFVKEAQAAGLHGLRGHRLVGGMRVSIYNAFPLAGVQALTAFLADFAQRHG
jgi:phosphoserine aminotransferase